MDWSKFTDWLQLKPRYLFAVACFSGLLLFLPSDAAARMGLEDLRETYKGWIGAAFLFATVLWITHGGVWLGRLGKDRWESRRHNRNRVAQLHTLGPDEREVLRKYLQEQKISLPFDMHDGAVRGLKGRGILYLATEVSEAIWNRHFFRFNMNPWYWEYLNKHPDILQAPIAKKDGGA